MRNLWETIKGSKALIGIGIVVAGFVILVIVVGIFGNDNSGEIDSLNSQVAGLQKSLSARNQRIDRLTSQNAQLTKQVGPIKSYDAKLQALQQQKADLESQKADLESQVSDVHSQVQDEQAKLQTAKQAVSKSTFGDGTWAVGPDITPGTYRAAGGHSCYWAILRDTNTSHIVDNGVSVSNPTVTLEEGRYFESDHCGTWAPGP